MAQTRRRVSPKRPNEARVLLELAERVTSKRGGQEALMRLAEADDSEVSLAAVVLPEHVGSLVFFDPTRFRDRAEIRAFVRSTEFAAYVAVASHTLIGGTAVPAQSGPVSEALLERAREVLHSILADLGTLAAIAAQGEGGPRLLRSRVPRPQDPCCAAGGSGPRGRVPRL